MSNVSCNTCNVCSGLRRPDDFNILFGLKNCGATGWDEESVPGTVQPGSGERDAPGAMCFHTTPKRGFVCRTILGKIVGCRTCLPFNSWQLPWRRKTSTNSHNESAGWDRLYIWMHGDSTFLYNGCSSHKNNTGLMNRKCWKP